MKNQFTKGIAALVVAGACGCAGQTDAQPTSERVGTQGAAVTIGNDRHVHHIPIGALVDQTGASTSPLIKDGITIAASQMNEALAKNHSNVTFDLFLGDTAGTVPAIAKSEALRLIDTEGALALVSDSSGDTFQVNGLNYDPATQAARHVPVTCFQCSSGFIHDPDAVDPDPVVQAAERDADHWLFRAWYNSTYEATVQDELISQKPNHGDANNDGLLKVGVYADPGHSALATEVGPLLSSFIPIPSTVEIIYYSTPANIASDWARVLDASNETTGQTDGPPDIVVVGMLPANITAAVEYYLNSGFKTAIQASDGFRRNYIAAAVGAIANGLEGTSMPLVDPSKSGQDFTKAFTEATGQGPELTSSSAYDATMTLMLAALVAAHDLHDPSAVTSADIRLAMTQINDLKALKIRPTVPDLQVAALFAEFGLPFNYEGAFNPCDWNSVGELYPPLVEWQIQNQQFVEQQYFQCDPAHPLCPPVATP